MVADPAVHTRLRVGLAPVGGRGVGVQELPPWVAEAATLVGPTVGARWDGDSQEGLVSGAPGTLAWAVLLSGRGTQQQWPGTAAEKFSGTF